MKPALLLLTVLALAQTPPSASTSIYYLVFLRPVPDRKPLAKEAADSLRDAHFANVHRMLDEGLLAAAGPFDNDAAIDGIFVMKTKSLDEARRVVSQDPMIRERRSVIDAHAWRAPAGIGDEYTKLHKEHPELQDHMVAHPIMLLNHGPEWESTEPRQRVVALANHLRYVETLHRDGKLAAAGPVEGDPQLVGIVVFHGIPAEEARQLMDADPAVNSGLLAVEAHRWWSADHVLPW